MMASADDFNLARFALLLSPPPSEDVLPLDDPNTDFTELSDFSVLGNSDKGPNHFTFSLDRTLVKATPVRGSILTHLFSPRLRIESVLRC